MENEAKQDGGNGDWSTTEGVARGIDSAAASLEGLDHRVRSYVDAHPFVAVGIAAVAGFLLGRLVARS